MNKIDQNYFKNGILSQYPQNFRASENNAPTVPLPDIYYSPNDSFEQKSFKDSVKQYDMFDMLAWIERPFLMLGTSAALLFGMDKFNKSFNGDFKDSIVGKASHFGDRIEKSSAIQNKYVQDCGKGIKPGWKSLKKFLCKNDAIRAMFETPGRPEWAMPLNEMLPTEQRLLENFNRIVSELELIDKNVHITQSNTTGLLGGGQKNSSLKLKHLGLDNAERKYLKGIYGDKRISQIINQEEAVNRILLKRLGCSDSEITSILSGSDATEVVREKLRQTLGLTKKELEEIATDTSGKHAEKVLKRLEKLKNIKAFRIGACHYDWMGKFQPFERHITMESVRNNLKSILDKNITSTGKFMARATQIAHKCLTFGGGKLAILMFIAPIFARAIVNTQKADKKEKVGTFTHDVVSGVSWIATFPLGMKLMHAFGGMQFAGMTPDEVKNFREALANLEKRNQAGEFKTYSDYKKAKNNVMKLRKAGRDGQSLFSRLCRKIGGFLEIGNENPKGWKKPNGNFIMNGLRRSGNFCKNFVGAPLRFFLFLMGINAALEGIISKACNKVFGKNYDAEKNEEQIERKKEQERFTKEDLQERLIKAQERKLGLTDNAQPVGVNEVGVNEVGVNNEGVNEGGVNNEGANDGTDDGANNGANNGAIEGVNDVQQQPNENPINTENNTSASIAEQKNHKTDNYTYIPSSENVIKQQQEEERKQKYIPSQEGANVSKVFDNSWLEKALRRADRAEARALDVLAGKYE